MGYRQTSAAYRRQGGLQWAIAPRPALVFKPAMITASRLPAQPPGWQQLWREAVTDPTELLALLGLSHRAGELLPAGDTGTLEELGWLLTADLTIHAWDLARAVNAQDEFPNDLVGAVLERVKVAKDRWFRPEAFAPSIPVPG